MTLINGIWGPVRDGITVLYSWLLDWPWLFALAAAVLIAGAAALVVTEVRDARQDAAADEITAAIIRRAAASQNPGEALDAAERYLTGTRSQQ